MRRGLSKYYPSPRYHFVDWTGFGARVFYRGRWGFFWQHWVRWGQDNAGWMSRWSVYDRLAVNEAADWASKAVFVEDL